MEHKLSKSELLDEKLQVTGCKCPVFCEVTKFHFYYVLV